MSTDRMTLGGSVSIRMLLVLATGVGSVGCASHTTSDFWAEGGLYDVALYQEGAAPDSRVGNREVAKLVVTLTLDAVRGDSIFGRYEGDFSPSHLMVGRATPGPQVFTGRVTGSEAHLELTPDATDAGLHLEGRWRDGAFYGQWWTETPRARGAYRLTRR